MVGQRPIDLQELSKYFNMPEKAVAKSLGVCLTSLKKICRQHGVTRWPYRKIKSLDKKLRKLEVAMTSAKDDPSMVFAQSHWVGDSSSSSASSPPCSEDASVASTPRQLDEFSPSPVECCSPEEHVSNDADTAEPQFSAGFVPMPVQMPCVQGSGQPIKIELSLTPEMLQSVASCGGNISFVVQGVEGASADSAMGLRASFASSILVSATCSPAIPMGEPTPAVVIKTEPVEEDSPAELSDEELIAMLAQCAGTEPSSNKSTEPVDLSDAEIMKALAACCEAPTGFDFIGDHLGGATSSEEEGGVQDEYMGIEAFDAHDMGFRPFSDFACGVAC